MRLRKMENRPIVVVALYTGQPPKDETVGKINQLLKSFAQCNKNEVQITVCGGVPQSQDPSKLEASITVIAEALKSSSIAMQRGGVAKLILALHQAVYSWKGRDLKALRTAICVIAETDKSVVLNNPVARECGFDEDIYKAVEILYNTYNVSWKI